MALATTKIADVIVPSVFDKYVQLYTESKSRLIQSGALVRDSQLDAFLAGGGLTFEMPQWKDLENDTENVSTDDETSSSESKKIGTAKEIAIRLNRNQSWSDMDLTSELAGSDPGAAIASRVGAYWVRRQQAAFVALITGVFADNAAAPAGTEHTINDMTVDIKGSSYAAGTTTFSAEAVIDAALTMGDSSDQLTLIMMHSVVMGRAMKNNLIDFIPDSRGEINIPTFLGRQVIVDDNMPASSGVYETWLFGNGAVRLGMGTAKVPTEIFRNPEKGTGGGMETLYHRVKYSMHPRGLRYNGTSPSGGPSNAASSNNLAHAGSWFRVAPERKMVKIARLITRESA